MVIQDRRKGSFALRLEQFSSKARTLIREVDDFLFIRAVRRSRSVCAQKGSQENDEEDQFHRQQEGLLNWMDKDPSKSQGGSLLARHRNIEFEVESITR